MTLTEPVGISDIADRLGVRPSAVSNWTKRYPDFPSPRAVIGRGQIAVFDWPDIAGWAWAHGKNVRCSYPSTL